MSAKSIKAFEQNTGGRHKPPLQDRLRQEAVELRHKAHEALHVALARAKRLDEMADELGPAVKR